MIALLTDFGTEDIYVGVMKSVILAVAPDAQIVDLSHAVPAHDVETGAFLLAASWPYLPADTIVVGVVDPGVGTSRRPIAVAFGKTIFVGPDNGLASFVLADRRASEAVELTDRRLHLTERVGNTFHGRDVFAPVAAHLHKGLALKDAGSFIDPVSLLRLPVSSTAYTEREILGTVKLIDRFGNMITDICATAFQAWIAGAASAEIRLQSGWTGPASVVANYSAASPGAPMLMPNSFGRIEIAIGGDSAAVRLGAVAVGTRVTIRRAAG